MVQRYNASYYDYYEDSDGEFVLYDDYLALLKEYNQLKERYNVRLAQLNETSRKLSDELDKSGNW